MAFDHIDISEWHLNVWRFQNGICPYGHFKMAFEHVVLSQSVHLNNTQFQC